MSYSVVWSGSEGEHVEQFGGNLVIPRKKGRKEREVLSDTQVCVVSQSSAWYLWRVDGSGV